MADRTVDQNPGLPYLLAELRAPFEAAALVPALPVLMRAPRGDGHHVVAIPPFGVGDAFTTVLRARTSGGSDTACTSGVTARSSPCTGCRPSPSPACGR